MTKKPLPQSGGSYSRDEAGSLKQEVAPTKEGTTKKTTSRKAATKKEG